MNANNPYDAFVALANLDQKLLTALKKREEIILSLDKLNADYNLQKALLEEIKNKQLTIRKDINLKELELKALRQREKTKKNQLDHVTSSKEYTSLNNELADIQSTCASLDDALMGLLQELEDTQKVIIQQQEVFEQTTKVFTQKKQALDLELERINHDVEGLQEFYNKHLPSVYPPLLEQYLSMKNSVPNPAAPAVDGTCSACFCKITTHDLNALKLHKIIHCRECFRFLYLA